MSPWSLDRSLQIGHRGTPNVNFGLVRGDGLGVGDTWCASSGPDVVTDLQAAINRHGRPERLLTDNGAVFTGSYRGHGWVAVEREAAALGIALRHSRPYHPQTCGKVERFHQTLKKWLAKQPRARTVEQLQTQLDAFADYDNTCRPHRGIDREASRVCCRSFLSQEGSRYALEDRCCGEGAGAASVG